MITKLLLAGLVMSLCVAIHAIGITGTLRWLGRSSPAGSDSRFWPPTWLLIRVAALLILMHLVEISLWALLFFWGDAMPSPHTAFYFSSVTYTTTGYGDLVLPESWRMVGGIEALTGILMCGLSTGFFFAAMSRVYDTGRVQQNGNGGR